MPGETTEPADIASSPTSLRDWELEMYKWQNQIYKDMHRLTKDVHATVTRVGALEKGHEEIKATLQAHEVQRRDMHDILEQKMDKLLDYIAGVEKDTKDNTNFVAAVRKYRVRITFIGTGVVSTLVGLYWLYAFLEKHGLVIIFEKGVQ